MVEQKEHNFDLAVIGGGPAGYSAAMRASQLGSRTVLIEKDELGGTCLNRGCVPTKTLLKSAELFHEIKGASAFGIEVGEPSINFEKIMQRKVEVVKFMQQGLSSLLKVRSVTLITGEASLQAQGTLLVKTEAGTEVVKAAKTIIASGSETGMPPIEGLAGAQRAITSEEALKLTQLPKKIAILGGGIVGLEFASYFGSLGSEVTIIEMLPRLAAVMDEEISNILAGILQGKGVKVLLDSEVKTYSENGKGCRLQVEAPGKSLAVQADLLLVAAGRKPAVAGLSKCGIALENGVVAVDRHMRTNLPGVYACGDITGNMMLAHVAFAEGRVAAENALDRGCVMDYRAVSSCLYGTPEAASVGLTETEAREKGYEVVTGRFPFQHNGKGLAIGDTQGLVKVISESKYHEILGVHIIGPRATELISEAMLAIHMEATAFELANSIHAHPTLSEALMEASLSLLGMPFHGG